MEKWVIKNKKGDLDAICRKFGITNITAKLLCNRGVCDEKYIESYLNPDFTSLYSPFEMQGMEKACEIIKGAVKAGTKMRIIGDYDVDGVTSTFIFLDGLKNLGADVDYRIPDRVKDGYGINENLVKDAAKDGVKLILTCDNGIRAVKEIALAYELGMKVVLTDHHDIPETVPKAEVVLNPKLPACNYPYTELCGAVVVLKLIEALNCNAGESHNFDIVKKYIEIASIATVCDVVELQDENRALVKLGMEKFKGNVKDAGNINLGLSALIEASKFSPAEMNTYKMGYVIGPCINATGRIDTAMRGIELLKASNPADAAKLAGELIELNAERKNMTNEALEEAEQTIIDTDALKDRILVILLENCHESIAGIVAGRIKESYGRPTIVLTHGRDFLKGSARSIETYNITAELDKCSDLLLHYGGHAMAAGLSLDEDKVSELRDRLNSNCTLTPEQMEKKVTIDLVMPTGFATERLCNELSLLEPFGNGNTQPLFAERNFTVTRLMPLGKEGKFLRVKGKNETGCLTEFTYFGDRLDFEQQLANRYGADTVEDLFTGKGAGVRISITYFPEINEYKGNRSVQLKMKNFLV